MRLQIEITIKDNAQVVERFRIAYMHAYGDPSEASPNQWVKFPIEDILERALRSEVSLRKFDLRISSEWIDANEQQVDVFILNNLGLKP